VDVLLAAIQKLYRIESRAKAMGLSLEARLQLRQREAKPIFMDVGQLIATLRKDVLPKSPLGRALSYAENQWPAMARYLEVAHAELDNNITYAASGISRVMPTAGLCRVAELEARITAIPALLVCWRAA
jgi:hypothetical protein